MAAVRSGDDRAFEKLYERYQRRIAAYIYGMVNDYGRSEDITQEVFISALRRMRETERPIAFKPWLYEIAKNACIDQFRRSKRAEEISFDADEGVGSIETARLVSTARAPEAEIDTKQTLNNLCGAFGGLSETHHQILVLREFEGLSYREIGERMGLSRPSVESTLFRARRRLSEEYDELISGQRCMRIQNIIVGAVEGSLGARDQRRLARHVAHCQPCRREARLANLDAAVLAHRPVHSAVAAKVAAFFPLPALARLRRGGDDSGFVVQVSGPLSTMAEPMMAGWTKAAAAAATLLVAGAGAGAISTIGSDGPVGVSPRESTPLELHQSSSATASGRDTGAAGRRREASAGSGANAKTPSAGSQQAAPKPLAGAPAPGTSATQPSRANVPTQPPAPPAVGPIGGGGGGGSSDDRTPEVPITAPPDLGAEVETKAYSVNQDAGDTVSAARDVLDGG